MNMSPDQRAGAPAARLLVVIPTRNRAELARRAITSVLGSRDIDVQLLVSDNSSVADQARELADFCQHVGDHRLHYCRPEAPLSMSRHWEWAIQQAISSLTFSHVAYLMDRQIVRDGQLRRLADLATRYPDYVISYKIDTINDYRTPVLLRQLPWTGRVFEVRSDELLDSVARLRIVLFPYLPSMANSIVPRTMLDTVQKRFSSVFGSLSPDVTFAFRCLEVADSILCYDHAPLVQYAVHHSSVYSLISGKASQAYTDWLTEVDERAYHATPLPGLDTIINQFLHEYGLVRLQTRSAKFPDIDRAAYVRATEAEINAIEDPQTRRSTQILLCAKKTELLDAKLAGAPQQAPAIAGVRTRLARVLLSDRVASLGRRLQRYGLSFPSVAPSVIEFETTTAALAHASRCFRSRNWGWSELELFTAARRLPRDEQRP